MPPAVLRWQRCFQKQERCCMPKVLRATVSRRSRYLQQSHPPQAMYHIMQEGSERTQQMQAAAVTYFSELLNHGNTALLQELVTADVVYSDPVWLHGPLKSRGRLQRYLQYLQSGYPDILADLHTVSCCEADSTVMVYWSCSGSNLREYSGTDASGRRSSWSGVTVFRFDSKGLIHSIRVFREPTEEERGFHMGWD